MRTATLALVLLLCAAIPVTATDEEFAARVQQVTADGLYLDAGAADGLSEGDIGAVRRDGSVIARVEVVALSSSSARVRLLGAATTEPRKDDLVFFRLRSRAAGSAAKPEPRAVPDTGPSRETEPFVPLLDRQKTRPESTRAENIAHGRVMLRQLLHFDNLTDFDYTTTILGLRGSLSRIGGSAWALRWNGNLSYRGGTAFDNSSLEGARADVYELLFTRPLGDGGILRLGRLLPIGIRAGGYLDGVQAELRPAGSLRLGGVLGLKPDRDSLDPSSDEPVAIPYATFTTGRRGQTYFSATTGLLASMYKGDFDRLALLFEGHLDAAGGKARLDLSLDADLDVGAAAFKQGSYLSRFDLLASYRAVPAIELRAGADHFERVDDRAERASLAAPDAALFDDGFWRYWVGLRARLGGGWSADAEVSRITDPVDPTTTHWRASVTRARLFGLPGASTSLSLYNLEGTNGADGVAGLLSAILPFDGGRWNLQPQLGFRSIDFNAESFDITDIRLRGEYRATKAWSFHLDLSYAKGTGLDSLLAELGATLRF